MELLIELIRELLDSLISSIEDHPSDQILTPMILAFLETLSDAIA